MRRVVDEYQAYQAAKQAARVVTRLECDEVGLPGWLGGRVASLVADHIDGPVYIFCRIRDHSVPAKEEKTRHERTMELHREAHKHRPF